MCSKSYQKQEIKGVLTKTIIMLMGGLSKSVEKENS